jgi:hypothetical protein
MGQSRGSSQAGAESVRSRADPKGSSRKEGEAEERSRSQGSGTTPRRTDGPRKADTEGPRPEPSRKAERRSKAGGGSSTEFTRQRPGREKVASSSERAAGPKQGRSRVGPKPSRPEGLVPEGRRSRGTVPKPRERNHPPTDGRTPEGRHRRPTARAEPQGRAKVESRRRKPNGAHEAQALPRNGRQLFGEGARDEAGMEPEWMDRSSGRGSTGKGWVIIGPWKVPRSQNASEVRFAEPRKGRGRGGKTSTPGPKG